MALLGKLFDVDPDTGEDGSVVWAKYRKRAPSCDQEENPAKKQRTEKNSYLAAAVTEENVFISELVHQMNHNRATLSRQAQIYLLHRSVIFVSGGVQYQRDVEASYSRPVPVSGREGEGGDSEEFGWWEKHAKGVGAKLLLQQGFLPGKGLGKHLQGRSNLLTERDISQGISGKVCRYSPSGQCRYGIRCRDFHLKTRVKTGDVSGQEVCRYFSSTGLCWYGDRCYYRHIKTRDLDWECQHCGFDNEFLWSKYCQDCGQFLTQFRMERN